MENNQQNPNQNPDNNGSDTNNNNGANNQQAPPTPSFEIIGDKNLPNQDLYNKFEQERQVELEKALQNQPPTNEPPAQPENNNQNNPPAEPQKPADPPQAKSLEQVLKEKYNWNSEEDIEKWKTENTKTVEVEKVVEKAVYANERLKALDEFVRKGGKEEDFYKTQFTDWDKKSAEEVIREGLKNEFPTATPKQLDILFKNRYNTNEDEVGEDVAEINKLTLTSAAEKLRSDFKAQQVKVLQINNEPSPEEIAEQKRIETFRNDWQAKAPATVQNLKAIEFDVEHVAENGDKNTYKIAHKVNEALKEQILDITKDPTKLIRLYADKNGIIDQNKLARGIYMAMNEEQVVKSVSEAYAANVLEAFIQKNLINAKPTQMPAQAAGKPNADQQLVTDYFASFPGRKQQ